MIIFNTILCCVAASVLIFVGIFIDFFFISQIVYGIRSMIIYRRNFHKEVKKKCRECKKCSCLFTDIEHTKLQDHELRLKFLEKHYQIPSHPRADEEEIKMRIRSYGEVVERKNSAPGFVCGNVKSGRKFTVGDESKNEHEENHNA